MTWASFLSRMLGIVLVLPLILTRFVPSDIALWYLFLSFIGIQGLADIGFGQSFIRVIAFANGGSTELKFNDEEKKIKGPNWDLIHKIVQTMRWTNIRICLAGFSFLIIIGSLSVSNVINKTPDPIISWISWAIIVIISSFGLWGRTYINYLTGLNEIPLLKRWEAISGLIATLSNFLVLFIFSNFFYLIISSQFWYLFNIARNYWLCRTSQNGEYLRINGNVKHKEIMKVVWPFFLAKRGWCFNVLRFNTSERDLGCSIEF